MEVVAKEDSCDDLKVHPLPQEETEKNLNSSGAAVARTKAKQVEKSKVNTKKRAL